MGPGVGTRVDYTLFSMVNDRRAGESPGPFEWSCPEETFRQNSFH